MLDEIGHKHAVIAVRGRTQSGRSHRPRGHQSSEKIGCKAWRPFDFQVCESRAWRVAGFESCDSPPARGRAVAHGSNQPGNRILEESARVTERNATTHIGGSAAKDGTGSRRALDIHDRARIRDDRRCLVAGLWKPGTR